MSSPLLSLCIPTNGIIELIFPVLESIYCQTDIDCKLFEVIVMDNGDNQVFKAKIKEYAKKHENLVYRETELKGFQSESECYRAASGLFIKFINHRTKLLPNTINYFLDFIDDNKTNKPSVYFSNGVIKEIKGVTEFKDFDSYIRNLHEWSSWSTGMGFWKEDFEHIPKNTEFNTLFPHTTVLFYEQSKTKYIIDNTVLLEEIPVDHANKGKYNLFYAFGVEYLGIVCDLLRNGAIRMDTFLSIKKDYLKLIAYYYVDFILLRRKCSYDLSNYKQNLEVFYRYNDVKRKALFMLCLKVVRAPFRKVKKLFNT